MARQYDIKWSDKDERELKRYVKNFNAKVARLEKKEPHYKDVRPQRISYKDIKEKVQTRQDLNRELNKIKRFSVKGSEEIRQTAGGVITTKYQFKEAAIMQRTVTTKRREKRAKVESAQVQEREVLYDKPKVGEVSPEGFQKYIKSLEREVLSRFDQQQKEAYLKNYITSCKENLGVYAAPIIDFVSSISLDIFVDQSLSNPLLTIDFTYSDAQTQELADAILEEWQRVT